MNVRLGIPFLLLLSAVLAAQIAAPSEVEITAEPSHHLVLENEYVRVFKVEVAPHAQTLMHRHRHDYMFVTLGATRIENDVAGKPPVTLTLQDGETRFSTGDFAHIAKNLSDTLFRNVTIELLKDEEARKTPPPKWDEERGLHVLEGGTQDILFVKDGVRVSEIDLQPGATLPRHHHAGPHLLVAVSDLELRSDVEGQGPMPGHFKSGDVKWLPGGYTHTLTNVGKSPAKLVTLEFPSQQSTALKTGSETIGTVVLRVVISERGKVLGAEVERSLNPTADKQALRAVKTWTFEPAKKDGHPVTVQALVEVAVTSDGDVLRADGKN
jgi:TonB family protein